MGYRAIPSSERRECGRRRLGGTKSACHQGGRGHVQRRVEVSADNAVRYAISLIDPCEKLLDLKQPKGTPARLTVCLITRNEERFLLGCLASVRDLAHQIHVVDTGNNGCSRALFRVTAGVWQR